MLTKDLCRDFYKKLKERQHILLLCNCDVDAVCTWRILQYLLHSDHIQYTMIPVYSRSSLIEAFTENCTEMVECVVLINCGANLNLVELLQPRPSVVFFVIDTHRPIHLENLYSIQSNTGENQQCWIIHPPKEDLSQVPILGDVLDTGQFDAEDDEEDGRAVSGDEEDFFGEGDENEGESRPKRRRREGTRLDTDAIARRAAKRQDRHRWEQRKREIEAEYYDNEYHSTSSALLLYEELSFKMHKDSPELLWWAIIGLTEQFLHCKLGSDQYTQECVGVTSHVSRWKHHANADVGYSKDCMKIEFFPTELLLALYRRWSIYESLQHSLLTACRFRVWSASQGQKNLKKFLVDLGLPLSESQQSFCAMKADYQKNIVTWMNEKLDRYRLNDLSFASFLAKFGFSQVYSACDMVHAVAALLELGDPSSASKSMEARFLAACDCLSRKEHRLLEQGFDQYKYLLRMVMQQVRPLVVMRQVKSYAQILMADVSESLRPYFQQPIALKTLAKFLQRAYITENKNKQGYKRLLASPLIISVSFKKDEEDWCRLIGIPPAADDKDRPKNYLGAVFAQAARNVGEDILHLDAFETYIVELRKETLSRFVDGLVDVLT